MATDTEATTEDVESLRDQLRAARAENEQLRAGFVHPKHTGRRVIAIILLVLGLGFVFPAEILLWANRTITNTDQYVQTVAPIIKKPSVQTALTKASTDALFARVNVEQEVKNLLPGQAQVLAAPIASEVKGYLTSTIRNFVASDKFAAVWVNVNRSAQQQFMKIASSKNATGAINIDQAYQVISQNLQDTSLGFLAGHSLPPKVGQITIVTIPALAKIPYYVSTLATLNWIFLGLAAGFLILALAVSPNRANMARAIGIGWMAIVVLSVVSVRITRIILLGQIKDPTYEQAASDIWQALLRPLFDQAIILFSLGLVMAIIAWLMGTSPRAVSWRSHIVGWFGQRRHILMPRYDQGNWSRALSARHAVALWTLLVITIAVLLLLLPLSLPTLIVVLIIAGLVWLAYEFLAAPIPG